MKKILISSAICLSIVGCKEKIAKEFELDKAIKEANNKEFDKWLHKLIKKNGTTKY